MYRAPQWCMRASARRLFRRSWLLAWIFVFNCADVDTPSGELLLDSKSSPAWKLFITAEKSSPATNLECMNTLTLSQIKDGGFDTQTLRKKEFSQAEWELNWEFGNKFLEEDDSYTIQISSACAIRYKGSLWVGEAKEQKLGERTRDCSLAGGCRAEAIYRFPSSPKAPVP